MLLKHSLQTQAQHRPLRVGFVPLCDCAPLALAHELGLFSQHGVAVELSREVGWATIRDKLLYGELEAAQATAPMVFAASLGLDSIQVPCVTGLVLNLHGNAITLSNRLWEAGVRDGASLRAFISSRGEEPPLTLGVVFRFSTHHLLLRQWLRAHRIDPDREVRLAVVPPPQMPANLRAGNLDGYCAGEPWNSVAVMQRTGWIAATSDTIAPWHPEKVLMVRQEFAKTRAEEHLCLVAAVYQACQFCDRPENREQVVEVLSRPAYVHARPEALRRSLCGPLALGKERDQPVSEFHLFARHNANEPTAQRAGWLLEQLRQSGMLPPHLRLPANLASTLFRNDIYEQAIQLHCSDA